MSTNPQDGLDLRHIPPYQSRSFVPDSVDLADVEQVKELFGQLLDRQITAPPDLEAFIRDRSELEAVLDQHGSVLYIRMTCQTDDKNRAAAYEHYISEVIPAIQPLDDKLNRKYLAAWESFPLDQQRYQVYNRNMQADIALFRDANVPLTVEVEKLSQEYQTVCGAMTVQFRGKEHTLPQMGKYGYDPDRSLREEAWRATTKRRLEEAGKIEDVFDNMLHLRQKLAENADCADFREYMFRQYHRFDYTPADCKAYHAAVEKLVTPLYGRLLEHRREQMGLASLRPWDYRGVDPRGRPPLKPFEQVDELIHGVGKIFARMDAELGGQFQQMTTMGLLDLESRKGKAPGGYMDNLSEIRRSFIFMNAVGTHDDLITLLHESGHAFHGLACRDEPLASYRRHIPMEFCEVASMAMELLAGSYLDAFYTDADIRRARYDHFTRIVQILCWIAVIDAFQHWLYENPDHRREQRSEAWKEIYNRYFGQDIDWNGLENELNYLWHRQLHIFQVPFYYIEYGIAQLGALGIWMQALKDEKQALSNYRRALQLGGSAPLPKLFETAGVRFDFSEQTIGPLMDAVTNSIDEVSQP